MARAENNLLSGMNFKEVIVLQATGQARLVDVAWIVDFAVDYDSNKR